MFNDLVCQSEYFTSDFVLKQRVIECNTIRTIRNIDNSKSSDDNE